MTLTIDLTEAEYARLTELAAASGRAPGEVLKERAALAAPPEPIAAAPDPYPNPPPHPPEQAHLFADWASWPLRKRKRFQALRDVAEPGRFGSHRRPERAGTGRSGSGGRRCPAARRRG